ncbi:MAG: hypothetical protein K1X83_10055 [Oligoflexia bacterium]|nr:hypothetical protein [Oligoflexia bacterium]
MSTQTQTSHRPLPSDEHFDLIRQNKAVLKLHDRGDAVLELNRKLGLQGDVFTEDTWAAVRRLQRTFQITRDGKFGVASLEALDSIPQLQAKFGLLPTGKFGPEFIAALENFQRGQHLADDAKIGPKTAKALAETGYAPQLPPSLSAALIPVRALPDEIRHGIIEVRRAAKPPASIPEAVTAARDTTPGQPPVPGTAGPVTVSPTFKGILDLDLSRLTELSRPEARPLLRPMPPPALAPDLRMALQPRQISVAQAAELDTLAAEALARSAEELHGHHTHSRSRCMRGVRKSLEALPDQILEWRHTIPRAKGAIEVLKRDPQFVQVVGTGTDGKLTQSELAQLENKPGMIVVYKNPFHPRRAGHICITNGRGGAYSDFRQDEGIDVYAPRGRAADGYYVFMPVGKEQARPN